MQPPNVLWSLTLINNNDWWNTIIILHSAIPFLESKIIRKWYFWQTASKLKNETQTTWRTNESKQLLHNKSPRQGKLFPILKLSDNQSLLNATVSFYDFLFTRKWNIFREFEDLCKLFVREIKRKICVGNWANKRFVTEWHETILD